MASLAKTQQQSPLATIDQDTMTALMAGGDCSRLTPAQKNAYYVARCEAAGLDPRAQPFQFVRLNGKEVLYATKSATDQLAGRHGIVCNIVSQVTEQGLRVVTVRATSKDGRSQEDIGVVPVDGLKGDALANAFMKAITKAKRRTVLSLSGLGMLDESELETIPAARPVAPVSPVSPVEVVPTPSSNSTGEPEGVIEGEVVEQPFDETSAMIARIQAAQTMGDLMKLVPEIKTLPSERIAEVRAAYADQKATLTKAAGGQS